MKIKSWDDVDAALAEIATHEGIIAEAKAMADESKAAIAKVEPSLEEYVREHEDDLLDRSRAVDHGRVWLRSATHLGLIGRWSWKKVLDQLTIARRYNLIRKKPEVDKVALGELTTEALADLKVKKITEDVFGYEAV